MRLIFDIETVAAPDDKLGALPERIHCLAARDIDTEQEWLYVDEKAEVSIQEAHEWMGMDVLPLSKAQALLDRATLLIGHSASRFDVPVVEALLGYQLHGCLLYDTFSAASQQYFTNLMGRSYDVREAAAQGVRGEAARMAAMDAKLPARYCKLQSLKAWGWRLGTHKLEYTGGWERLTPDMATYCLGDLATTHALYTCLTERSAEPAKGWPVPPMSAMVVESTFSYLLGKQRRNGVGFDKRRAEALYDRLAPTLGTLEHEAREGVRPWFAPNGKLVVPKRSAVSGWRKPGKRIREACSDQEYLLAGRTDQDTGKSKPGQLKYRNVSAQPGEFLYYVDEYGARQRMPVGAYQPLKAVEFSPGSDTHVAHVLMRDFGWEPPDEDLTNKVAWINGRVQAQPTVKAETLNDLPFPIVKSIVKYRDVRKLMSMIADGKKAWLRFAVERQPGQYTIHGRVDPTGTRTSRCAHKDPNLAQIPKVKKGNEWGAECRSCFHPTREGWVQVGVDAAGLELRCLGHYMGYYDGGAFGVELLKGDVHAKWQKIAGLYDRDNQKTLTYALLYGAGDKKLGYIVIGDWYEAFEAGDTDIEPPPLSTARAVGSQVRDRLLSGEAALGDLTADVKEVWKTGFVVGVDGRVIACKSQHGALNDLLQSAGSIVMKWAHAIAYMRLCEAGLVHGRDYAFMLHVHDECQMEARPGVADQVGAIYAAAIVEAGEVLKFNIPLAGEATVGLNWKETH